MKTISIILGLALFAITLGQEGSTNTVAEGRMTIADTTFYPFGSTRFNHQVTGTKIQLVIWADSISGTDCKFNLGGNAASPSAVVDGIGIDGVDATGTLQDIAVSDFGYARDSTRTKRWHTDQFNLRRPYIYIEDGTCTGSFYY